MYFCTDLERIQAAMETKAPRRVEEVLLEYYPDCTVDRLGRAHAPYDGYRCEHTGNLYRGGEYLPYEFTEETSERSPVRKLWCFHEGKVVCFEGTKAQLIAGKEEARMQADEYDSKYAEHVGTKGDRINLKLYVLAVFSKMGFYGMEHTHLMRTEDMNPVVYCGSSKLVSTEGELLNVKATVKNTWTSAYGRKATYIARPRVGK